MTQIADTAMGQGAVELVKVLTQGKPTAPEAVTIPVARAVSVDSKSQFSTNAMRVMSSSALAGYAYEMELRYRNLSRTSDKAHNGYHQFKSAYLSARRILSARGAVICGRCAGSGTVMIPDGVESIACDWTHTADKLCWKCGNRGHWEAPLYKSIVCPICGGVNYVTAKRKEAV